MRGPGEAPLQVRKGTMRQRVKRLKQKLERIVAHRGKTREHRNLPGADIYVDDRPFATLDTTTRVVHLGLRQEVLVSDTVGFIRHLPHRLVASFRSTLEEAAGADALILVAEKIGIINHISRGTVMYGDC